MTAKKPASAESKDVTNSANPIPLEGVKLIRMPLEENKVSHPAALFKGSAPKAGSTVQFTLDNGVTYRGEVADAVDANGEVMVEFSGALEVAPTE